MLSAFNFTENFRKFICFLGICFFYKKVVSKSIVVIYLLKIISRTKFLFCYKFLSFLKNYNYYVIYWFKNLFNVFLILYESKNNFSVLNCWFFLWIFFNLEILNTLYFFLEKFYYFIWLKFKKNKFKIKWWHVSIQELFLSVLNLF